MIQSGEVITRIMKKGDFQNLPAGTVHRMMALSDDAKVLESSTPDRHAADKSVPKDVVRLHCVHGRECESFDDAQQQAVVERSIQVTEEAIATLEQGGRPAEISLGMLDGAGVVFF
jgi:allophanate hydrolase subunit 2